MLFFIKKSFIVLQKYKITKSMLVIRSFFTTGIKI